MKVNVNINNIKTVNEFDFYWSDADFIYLLEKVDFPDADKIKPENLREYLFMAISDFEPNEAAEILLTYKLGDQLTEGQIQSISHEMIEDKIAEQYRDPAFHYDLFNINQLLFKAYNGTFPNTEASIIELELKAEIEDETEVNKEVLTKALAAGLSDRSIILRLYADQIDGNVEFGDASKIIWLFSHKGENNYEMITSRYWVDKEDIEKAAYETEIKFFEETE
ncbi:MAG: hypothetical protein IPL55_15970 [Saprospiraceae bacterium]|jgi:hypothetical protein|nr:hypothetical protein [Saprospiraceae bacterium]MBL0023569.1 hypothetical protein [Saprospiraceae bacterium]